MMSNDIDNILHSSPSVTPPNHFSSLTEEGERNNQENNININLETADDDIILNEFDDTDGEDEETTQIDDNLLNSILGFGESQSSQNNVFNNEELNSNNSKSIELMARRCLISSYTCERISPFLFGEDLEGSTLLSANKGWASLFGLISNKQFEDWFEQSMQFWTKNIGMTPEQATNLPFINRELDERTQYILNNKIPNDTGIIERLEQRCLNKSHRYCSEFLTDMSKLRLKKIATDAPYYLDNDDENPDTSNKKKTLSDREIDFLEKSLECYKKGNIFLNMNLNHKSARSASRGFVILIFDLPFDSVYASLERCHAQQLQVIDENFVNNGTTDSDGLLLRHSVNSEFLEQLHQDHDILLKYLDQIKVNKMDLKGQNRPNRPASYSTNIDMEWWIPQGTKIYINFTAYHAAIEDLQGTILCA